MNLPTFEVYCNYSSQGYGAHALRFFDPENNCFWFSYQTLVAFTHNGKRYVRQNDWSTTTGKHLNAIDGGDKKSRLPADQFQAAFDRCYGVRKAA